MKGTIKVLSNQQGHSTTEFDTETGVVEEAEQVLAVAARNGAQLFSGTTKEHIGPANSLVGNRTVLEENEEILVISPVAGG